MKWIYRNKELDEVPENAYGFIYVIFYKDGTYYVGKKTFWSNKTMKPLSNGQNREGGKFFSKIVNNKRTLFESVKQESNWRKYNGSSDATKGLDIDRKLILKIRYDAINLTYAEAESLFAFGVLTDSTSRNGNILGKFFKGKIEQ